MAREGLLEDAEDGVPDRAAELGELGVDDFGLVELVFDGRGAVEGGNV